MLILAMRTAAKKRRRPEGEWGSDLLRMPARDNQATQLIINYKNSLFFAIRETLKIALDFPENDKRNCVQVYGCAISWRRGMSAPRRCHRSRVTFAVAAFPIDSRRVKYTPEETARPFPSLPSHTIRYSPAEKFPFANSRTI